jgi:hypothetical protein
MGMLIITLGLALLYIRESDQQLGADAKREEVEEDYILRSFITCTLHQILLG